VTQNDLIRAKWEKMRYIFNVTLATRNRVRRTVRERGDLKGHVREKTGRMILAMAMVMKVKVMEPTTAATNVFKCQRKSNNPKKKKTRAV
jgi:hypothetical protein